MTPTHDLLLASRGWCATIRERHALDQLAHKEGRAHQKVDPEAHPDLVPGIGENGQVTAWVTNWIAFRIRRVAIEQSQAKSNAERVLAELPEEHAARVRDEWAMRDYGATHEVTRARIAALRAKVEVDPNRTEADRAEILKMLDEQQSFLTRHETTAVGRAALERSEAEQTLADANAYLSVAQNDLILHYRTQLEGELKAAGATSTT